ncbi:BQ5605_C001g00351 [Microbotryum silenes-dioicae]|uniref:BQ5605_C001g00351 protein n=1 Tax=Microbotryum silenes-dioicae TaxID=796604 RepID=A0A2X0NZZ0_9BASI|nr:BQ5605_C001g00351 [Microbotryum silenes-dioicae]
MFVVHSEDEPRDEPLVFFIVTWMHFPRKVHVRLLGEAHEILEPSEAAKAQSTLPRVIGPDVLLSDDTAQTFHNFLGPGRTFHNAFAVSSI